MSNARSARLMLREYRSGALSTLSLKFAGHPFGSIVPFLADHDGSLLILISSLAEHTKNIRADPRVSLATHDPRATDVQAQGRVTLIGHAVAEPNRAPTTSRYLRYFPEADQLLQMSDFAFFRIRPLAIRFIGGFGQIHWVKEKDYVVPGADEFTRLEDELLGELNGPRHASLCRLVQKKLGIVASKVRAIGLDCDGLDVLHEERIWRVNFSAVSNSPSLDALDEKKQG